MYRKKFSVLSFVLVLALALSVSSPALAQNGARPAAAGDAKSYIVIMRGDPILTYDGGIAGYEATNPGKGNKVNPNSAHVQKYEKFLESKHNESLQNAGVGTDTKVHDFAFAINGYSALLTESQAGEIKSQKDVLLVLEDQLRTIDTDSSPAYLGLTAEGGAYVKGYTGEGVVVGIIDTGIWPEHPSFADDGSFPAPPTGPLPCNFGNTAHNPNDAPFTCNNKLIGAYQMLATYRALIGAAPDEFNSARDDSGHGTHTASTTAGNAGVSATLYGMPAGTISGIAPRAHIIAYKGLGNLGGFTSDLAAAIDQAVADGVDVINYSIGGGAGAVTADEIAFLFAADAGVFVSVSAGNSGPNPSTLGDPGTKPWVTTVGASTQSRFLQGTIILGNGAQYTGASITAGAGPAPLVDAASLGNPLCLTTTPFSSSVAGKIVVCRRGTNARVAKSQAVFNAGGVGMIMHENSDAGNLFSDTHWVPTVHVDQTPGLAIKAYIAATPGATAQIVAPQTGVWPYAPSMTDFSSRGPNPVAPDIIKPDVTAPGLQILAGNSPFPDAGSVPGELFQAIAGTSMSSPHVAGVYALLKQAHPEWSAAMAKSALMTTASQNVLKNNRTSPADPFDMGAGHIRPGGEWSKGSITEPGLVYDAGFLDYLGFMCDAFPAALSNPASTCATLSSLGIPTKAINLNYPSIGISQVPGTKSVTRTVTSVAKESGWRTYTADVVAPPGYTVTVSPSTIKLKTGESATFTVTVTNVSAPVGQWRFGSLTWREKDGNYSVYSPIAVKGALFEGPAEVSGSYTVSFGYTGPFTATARGLVPAALTIDTVADDPTNGACTLASPNAKLIPVVIPAGTTYTRFQLFDADVAPNSDIDICLFNSANALVAQSTSGTSAEVINLTNPAAGNYTLVIQGWSVPGSSPFKLHTWVLGSTAAGNMTVSAPASATIGTIGSINLTFSGLAPGTKYLGSVAYSGVAGLPNPTIVRVDVP